MAVVATSGVELESTVQLLSLQFFMQTPMNSVAIIHRALFWSTFTTNNFPCPYASYQLQIYRLPISSFNFFVPRAQPISISRGDPFVGHRSQRQGADGSTEGGKKRRETRTITSNEG